VNFDDAGIQLSLNDHNNGVLCPTFAVLQKPPSVQDLTLAVTTSYTQPVTQIIYLWDFSQAALNPIDVASIGSPTTTRFVDLSGLVGGASQIQKFMQILAGTVNVSPPGCGVIATTTGTVIMKIYAVATASFTGTLSANVLTAFFTSTTKFSMTLVNSGTGTIHLVSFWITGSSGPTQFASTLGGSSRFDVWLAPGQTLSVTLNYAWTPGRYALELVSARGNIFSQSVTAT
jgi:hypothetical protein